MAIYQSDYEKFRQEMRAAHPDWESAQRAGLARLWDKRLDPDEQRAWRESAEKRKAYPYDVNF
jgi:hypothetical protein